MEGKKSNSGLKAWLVIAIMAIIGLLIWNINLSRENEKWELVSKTTCNNFSYYYKKACLEALEKFKKADLDELKIQLKISD